MMNMLDEFRHARPDLSTGIDGVRIFRADRPDPPTPTTYGTVLALVAPVVRLVRLLDQPLDILLDHLYRVRMVLEAQDRGRPLSYRRHMPWVAGDRS